MTKDFNRKCPICGILYFANPDRLKYGRETTCSRQCSYTMRSKNITKSIEISCAVCGKKISRPPSLLKSKNVFCSKECHYKGRSLGLVSRNIINPYNCYRKSKRICIVCKKEYVYRKINQKYCSKECFNIDQKETMKGENNPSYKDGSSYKKRSWRGVGWDDIRKSIYKRDMYTCTDCGVKCLARRDIKTDWSSLIQCHHIEKYNGINNDEENLITLCLKCHLVRHGVKYEKN